MLTQDEDDTVRPKHEAKIWKQKHHLERDMWQPDFHDGYRKSLNSKHSDSKSAAAESGRTVQKV